jgi:hypothetical protein
MTTATAKLTGEVGRAGVPGYQADRIGWNRPYCRYREVVMLRNDAQSITIDASLSVGLGSPR